MAIKKTSIPAVPNTDPATYSFLTALKQNVEGLVTGIVPAAVATTATSSTGSSSSTASVSILLSNYSAVLPADSSGVVSSYLNAAGQLYVFAGGSDVTAACSLGVASTVACTGTINTATNTPVAGQPKGFYQVTAVTANAAQIVLQAVYEGLTLTATMGIAKAIAGTAGAAGTGSGAITLQLSAPVIVLPAYANGAPTSYGTANGLARMFNGPTEVTASTTFSAVAVNCTGTINTATNTPVSGQPLGYYQITNMTGTTATFTISGVYSGNTVTQVVNLTIAQGGYEIVSSLPTTNLFQGRIAFYTADNKLYRYDGGAWVTWVQASDVTGQINAAQIQDGIITTAKLLPGLSAITLVTTLPTPGISGRVVYLTADQQLYRDTGTAWTTAVPAVNITGQITNSQIGPAAVSTANLVVATTGGALNSDPNFADPTAWNLTNATAAQFITVTDGAVGVTAFTTSGAAVDNNLTSRTFALNPAKSYRVECWCRLLSGSGTIYMRLAQMNAAGTWLAYSTGYEGVPVPGTWTHLVAAVTPPAGTVSGMLTLDLDYPSSTGIIQVQGFSCTEMVSSNLIVPNSITTNQIAANSINAGHLQAGSVTTGSMAANSINGDVVTAGTMNANALVANSITAGQIAAGAITTSAMLAGSINGDRIIAGTLAAATIAANSITAAMLQANSVTAAAIAAGTITADRLQAGSITAAQIAASAITAIQIAAGTITAAQIAAGSITGNRIAGSTITGTNIAGATITATNMAAGSITAANAAISTAAVNTLQIAGNAVTVPGANVSGVAVAYTAAYKVAVCSPAMTTDGTFPFFINALSPGTVTPAGSVAPAIYFAIGRSTVPLAIGASAAGLAISTLISAPPSGSYLVSYVTGPVPMMWLDSPPAGTYYYIVVCTQASAGTAINVLGTKR